MHWRLILTALLTLGVSPLFAPPGVSAQSADSQVPIATFSQYLRTQRHRLSDAETAFFDADEAVQTVYAQALVNVDLLSRVDPERRNDEWRQALLGELGRILATDPASAPAAPPNLQRLRELGIAQRTNMWAAARRWLDALQAGDPEWLQRGGDEFRAALQGMSNWQQELVALYPPPQQP